MHTEDREDNDNTTSSAEFLKGAVESVAAEDERTITLKENETFIHFNLDMGSQANMTPERVLAVLKEKPWVVEGKQVKLRA